MDCCRRIVVIACLCLPALTTQAQANTILPAAARWLAPNVSLSVMAFTPVECLNPAAPPTVVLGRLAFESPALLGGQAARMGLACASCHLAARANPHFYLAGISNVAGRADVSQSFLSSSGGNDEFRPVPIPDLARQAQRGISDRNQPAFYAKLQQLIQVEFDGQAPLPEVFDAVATYLQNIDERYCEALLTATRPRTWQADWQRLLETKALLHTALAQDNSAMVEFLVRVARYRLETIYRATALAEQLALQRGLVAVSRALLDVVAAPTVAARLQALDQWQQQLARLQPQLIAAAPASAYSDRALAQFELLDKKSRH